MPFAWFRGRNPTISVDKFKAWWCLQGRHRHGAASGLKDSNGTAPQRRRRRRSTSMASTSPPQADGVWSSVVVAGALCKKMC